MRIQKKFLGVIILLVMVFLMVTVGCGKQTTENHTPVKTEHKTKSTHKKTVQKTLASELKQSSKKTLVYSPYGDSISVGLLSDSQTNRFSSQFARSIEKATGKKVDEEGSSKIGVTATNYGVPHINDIISQNPDIVTVEFATNDAADVTSPQAYPNYKNSLHQILDDLQQKTHAKIILMTTWSPADGKYIQNDLRFDKVVIDEGKARNLPVVNLSQIWQNNPSVTKNDLGFSTVYNVPKDEFHPNQLGHDEIAKALTKVLYEPIK